MVDKDDRATLIGVIVFIVVVAISNLGFKIELSPTALLIGLVPAIIAALIAIKFLK